MGRPAAGGSACAVGPLPLRPRAAQPEGRRRGPGPGPLPPGRHTAGAGPHGTAGPAGRPGAHRNTGQRPAARTLGPRHRERHAGHRSCAPAGAGAAAPTGHRHWHRHRQWHRHCQRCTGRTAPCPGRGRSRGRPGCSPHVCQDCQGCQARPASRQRQRTGRTARQHHAGRCAGQRRALGSAAAAAGQRRPARPEPGGAVAAGAHHRTARQRAGRPARARLAAGGAAAKQRSRPLGPGPAAGQRPGRPGRFRRRAVAPCAGRGAHWLRPHQRTRRLHRGQQRRGRQRPGAGLEPRRAAHPAGRSPGQWPAERADGRRRGALQRRPACQWPRSARAHRQSGQSGQGHERPAAHRQRARQWFVECPAADAAAARHGCAAGAAARPKNRSGTGRRPGSAWQRGPDRAGCHRQRPGPAGPGHRQRRTEAERGLGRAPASLAAVAARHGCSPARHHPARPGAAGRTLARRPAQPAAATAQRRWRRCARAPTGARRHPCSRCRPR